MRALLKRFGLITALVASAAAPAAAQNYDSAHQVRSGVFGQWGIFRGDGVRGGLTEDFSFGSFGIGFAAGLEYVRKETWSYGIELDGAVHSGQETFLSDTRYRPNLSASLRLRAGRHVRQDLYWYGTIGAAMLGAETKIPRFGQTIKNTHFRPGLVLGTGIERDFGPGLFFAEYLFTNYSGKTSQFDSGDTTIDSASHIVRVGVKYKVGYDHYADDVVERIGDRLRRRD